MNKRLDKIDRDQGFSVFAARGSRATAGTLEELIDHTTEAVGFLEQGVIGNCQASFDFTATTVSNAKVIKTIFAAATGALGKFERNRRRFYEIALGSIRETQTLIEILDLKEIRKLTDQLAASAYCLCRSLRDEGAL